MGQVGDVPEYDILLLDALVVLSIPELASGSEYPRDILARACPPDRDVVTGEGVSVPIIFQRAISGTGENPSAMPCRLVSHEPDTVRGGTLDIVPLVRIFPPSWPPPDIRAAVIVCKDLVHSISIDIEIKPPIRMMHMVRIARQTATLQDGTYLSILGKMPGLINMILADSRVDADFQPLHPMLRRAFNAYFLVPTVGDGNQVAPP